MSEFQVHSISGAADQPPSSEHPSGAKPQLAILSLLFIIGILLPEGVSKPVVIGSVTGICLVSFYNIVLNTWRNNRDRGPIVKTFAMVGGLALTYFLVSCIVFVALFVYAIKNPSDATNITA